MIENQEQKEEKSFTAGMGGLQRLQDPSEAGKGAVGSCRRGGQNDMLTTVWGNAEHAKSRRLNFSLEEEHRSQQERGVLYL